MAKQRYVRTSFRTDSYIEGLSPNEKLVFLYLLTNESTNLCGIYEISVKRISFETGLKEEEVRDILDQFNSDNRVLYIKGFIYIIKYTKHQVKNPSTIEGIKREIDALPKRITDELDKLYTDCSRRNTVCLTLPYFTLPNSTKPNQPKIQSEEEAGDKITDAVKRRNVNTKGKFWITEWNNITGRNDVMDSDTFRGLQNFIQEMETEDFIKRAKIFQKCKEKVNQHKLSRFFNDFGKNNIQDYVLPDFIKKINLFGSSEEEIFRQIIHKDYINKVLKLIKYPEPDQQPKPEKATEPEPTEEEKTKRKQALDELKKKMTKM